MTWHVETSILVRYVTGELGTASVMSIEAHLLGCEECRATLPRMVDRARLDRMWVNVRDAVNVPQPRRIERLLLRLGVADHTARLLVTTASLQLPWIAAMVVNLAFAVAASHAFGSGDLPFLIVAPVIPVLGVAWAFGRRRDPVWEVGRATPIGGLRLTLVRTVSVLAVSMIASAITCLALPRAGWAAVAWLVPALGLTALTLALSTTRASTEVSAVGVGTAWVLAVALAARLGSDPLAAFGVGGQSIICAVTVVATVALFARRDSFERDMGSEGCWG